MVRSKVTKTSQGGSWILQHYKEIKACLILDLLQAFLLWTVTQAVSAWSVGEGDGIKDVLPAHFVFHVTDKILYSIDLQSLNCVVLWGGNVISLMSTFIQVLLHCVKRDFASRVYIATAYTLSISQYTVDRQDWHVTNLSVHTPPSSVASN